MRLLHLNPNIKLWLISLILVLAVNLVVFLFRERLSNDIAIAVVGLTPVAWLVLTLLFRFIGKKP